MLPFSLKCLHLCLCSRSTSLSLPATSLPPPPPLPRSFSGSLSSSPSSCFALASTLTAADHLVSALLLSFPIPCTVVAVASIPLPCHHHLSLLHPLATPSPADHRPCTSLFIFLLRRLLHCCLLPGLPHYHLSVSSSVMCHQPCSKERVLPTAEMVNWLTIERNDRIRLRKLAMESSINFQQFDHLPIR